MALACGARALIADEPTTALDVSVQREVLALLRDIVARRRIGLVVISHDLGVLNELCERLVVMYRGEIVETGPAGSVLSAPEHPYTQALIDCLPRLGAPFAELPEIVPLRPAGPDGECLFRSRCPAAVTDCARHPALAPHNAPDRMVRCWNPTSERTGRSTGSTPALDVVHKEQINE
jgi:oligopeptide/dipeptide ABC transporter ATP-binding protein